MNHCVSLTGVEDTAFILERPHIKLLDTCHKHAVTQLLSFGNRFQSGSVQRKEKQLLGVCG